MTTKKEEIIEGEVVENNPIVKVEDLPIRGSERIDADTVIANIDAQEKILTRLIRYVNEKLKPKVDYYSVKEGQLPSLGLSGAEKICDIFKLAPSPILEEKIVTPQEVSYEYIVKLHNRYTGDFMGSGVGCCSSLEDKFRYYYDKNGDRQEIKNHLNIANTIKKIAYKRGYVDATLKATMASFIFTQDLEELPDYYIGSKSKKPSSKDKGQTKEDLQKLDPTKFKVPFKKSKYMGMVLTDCPKWWLEGQLKYAEDGKFIPSKYGYDDEEYKNMFRKAIEIKDEEQIGKEFEQSEQGKLKV